MSIFYVRTLSIVDTINGYVEPYINQVLTLLNGFEPWIQALIFLAVAIFLLVGLFVFIKKFIKLFLVIAILGAVFYYVYTQTDILNGIIGTIITIGKNVFTNMV